MVSSRPTAKDGFPIVAVLLLGSGLYLVGLLFWLAGQFSAVLTGNGWPDSSPADVLGIVVKVATRPGDPAAAWPAAAGDALGPAWLLYLIFLVFLVPVGYAGVHLVRLGLNWRRRRKVRVFRLGFASGHEVRQLLGAGNVVRKAKSVVPSMAGRKSIDPREVGFFLGRDIRSRRELFASVEDVFVVLAPPRQGKDVHFCTPYTIDAPGPCIVTSTRADAFSNTYAMRAKLGKVYVFDPNGMTCWPERLRWSPVRGCDRPIIAQRRARALISGAGLRAIGEGAIYVSGGTTILRCFLHAAALAGRTMIDIHRWCAQQINPEPISILRRAEEEGRAAAGWAAALEALTIGLEPRGRSAMFANANVAISCFADPAVMEACSPSLDEEFDLAAFLSGRNTLYLLGKEEKEGGIAPVITALMEDMFDGARKRASRMPGSRLDPPLTVELNEAAHIAPLPNLPAYMGDSGGFSIALHVYLQSLSQARSKWGEHEAMIMWDNAAVRIIMGGAGNVEDLEDISRLMGEFDEPQNTRTRGDLKTTATSHLRRRVLAAEEIRTLKFGTAVIVARSARPVEVKLTPWWKRKDGKEIAAGKAQTEKLILRYSDEAERHADAKATHPTFSMSGTSLGATLDMIASAERRPPAITAGPGDAQPVLPPHPLQPQPPATGRATERQRVPQFRGRPVPAEPDPRSYPPMSEVLRASDATEFGSLQSWPAENEHRFDGEADSGRQ